MMLRRFAAVAAGRRPHHRRLLERPTRKLPSAGGNAEVGKTNDINPQDPATLRQGGNLRLALTEYPSNFNSLHIDGNQADSGAMLRATMPRAFRVGSDGSTTVNTDYFTNVELTSDKPAGRHLHHQPQGGLVRRHADHLGGHRVSDQRDQRQEQGLPRSPAPTAPTASVR